MAEVDWYGCLTLEKEGLWDTENCCRSCHHEWDVVACDPLMLKMPDGRTLAVCCAAKAAQQEESLVDMIIRQSTREKELITQVLRTQAAAAVSQLRNYVASVKENGEWKHQP